MVYVNGKKLACGSCIKGHRSSSCHHTDRPLFEIKKKGRPVSQCNKCRELRQSKGVHDKCTCNETDEVSTRAETSRVLGGTKHRRYVPISPALPNGLRDVLRASRISPALSADPRQRVDALLNPCRCGDVWECKCHTSGRASSKGLGRGLDALARAAAAIHDSGARTSTPAISSDGQRSQKSAKPAPSYPRISRDNIPHKRPKSVSKALLRGPDLPPILLGTPSSSGPRVTLPNFETMPPMSMMTSLAGSGCTCGLQCRCPGCLEHRGPDHALKDRKDCADGCGTCIDHSAGFALPGYGRNDGPGIIALNYLDKFFACAAALPAPPRNRRRGAGMDLDPMDVTVYPDTARDAGERSLAFGLVNLPKLECCGGRCGCAGAVCGCGKTCDGCCDKHGGERAETPRTVKAGVSKESRPTSNPVSGSCCASKSAV